MRDVGLRSMAGHTRKRARTGSRSSLRGLALSLRSSKGTESRELARKLYIKKRNPYNTDARRCVPLAVYGPWLAGRPPCTGSAARPREARERQHPRCNMRRMFRFEGAESVGANSELASGAAAHAWTAGCGSRGGERRTGVKTPVPGRWNDGWSRSLGVGRAEFCSREPL